MSGNYCLLLEKQQINIDGKDRFILKFLTSCIYSNNEINSFSYEADTAFNIKFWQVTNSKYYFFPIENLGFEVLLTESDENLLLDTYDEFFSGKYFNISSSESDIHISEIKDKKILNQIHNRNNIVPEENIKATNDIKNISLHAVYNNVLEVVKGQDEHVKSILSSIIWNQKLNESDLTLNEKSKNKHNILIMGPTGVGKTEIIRQISENINIPFAVVDATEYTKSGYVGKNVDNMLVNLYYEADGNLDLAEKSILVIDEFDKLARNSERYSSVGNEGVQRSLLTLIEGAKKDIKIEDKIFEFNTHGLTVILLGAFSDLYKSDKNIEVIGFNQDNGFRQKINKAEGNIIENLSQYGIEDEILGRINKVRMLNKLDKQILLEILKSKKGRLMKTLELLKKQGVSYEIDDASLDEIVNRALIDNKGARSLNRIVDEIIDTDFNDVMFGDKKHIKIKVKKEC